MNRCIAFCIALCCTSVAFAHVTLETQQAPAESYYKAVVRVPHGCDGSPTIAVRVRIPEGVTGVKIQPKPGWKTSVAKEKAASTADSHGNKVTETVREVTWRGGRLDDDSYDEFVMQVKLPNAPETTLYFPVVQECVKGTHRWIQVPEPGKTSRDYKEPAPGLRLLPAQKGS